jgi:hypothetical protein
LATHSLSSNNEKQYRQRPITFHPRASWTLSIQQLALYLQPAPNFACGGWPPGANFAPINATFAEQIEQHLGLNIIMKS